MIKVFCQGIDSFADHVVVVVAVVDIVDVLVVVLIVVVSVAAVANLFLACLAKHFLRLIN